MTKAERQALWETRIAAYQASGQSVREWCATHEDVSPKQLWYWLRKYNDQEAVPQGKSINRWLPVEITEQTSSKPLLDAFLAWLKNQKARVLPKSSFGQAIYYCLAQWDKLVAFLQDGRLELNNNRSERSIKPFVIGRKNWLFANTPRGAKASAIIYLL